MNDWSTALIFSGRVVLLTGKTWRQADGTVGAPFALLHRITPFEATLLQFLPLCSWANPLNTHCGVQNGMGTNFYTHLLFILNCEQYRNCIQGFGRLIQHRQWQLSYQRDSLSWSHIGFVLMTLITSLVDDNNNLPPSTILHIIVFFLCTQPNQVYSVLLVFRQKPELVLKMYNVCLTSAMFWARWKTEVL